MNQFLVQMAGIPGSGKSTLARALGLSLPAVVLDYDVIKTALLDQGVSFKDAGHLAYETNYQLASSILSQGQSVILDSPCRFARILEMGQAVSSANGAQYRYVECKLDDRAELRRRLLGRSRLRSHVVDLGRPSPDASEEPNSVVSTQDTAEVDQTLRPTEGYLRVDSRQPVHECLSEVLAFLMTE